jgi:hypothetical protein
MSADGAAAAAAASSSSAHNGAPLARESTGKGFKKVGLLLKVSKSLLEI